MAKRKAEYIEPLPTKLIVPKEEFKGTLKERIGIGKTIKSKDIKVEQDFIDSKAEFHKWNDYNSEFLKQSFNNESNEYRDRYDNCSMFVGFVGFRSSPETPREKLKNFQKEMDKKIDNLENLLAKSDLLKSEHETVKTRPTAKTKSESLNIFIVHGHDDRTKLDVARTIEKLGLNPIILSEQPNQGQTIIEKFELHSDVGFAVILLTADDLGKTKTDKEEKYRARQNVIIEMGYFIGKLGRSKVFPLYEDGVELPSDLHGILYNPIDKGGSWKFRLAKELSAAGYTIDANKLIK